MLLLSFGLVREAGASGGSDLAMAEALFQEARKLVEQKRFAEACPKFAESQRLDPGIGTLLNLAACHELEGKTATAWSEFTQALGMAERESRADAQQFARGHLAALTPRLPKITIIVPKESESPGLEVSLDGETLGKPAWGLVSPIDPGTHVIAAAATAKKRWTTQITFGPAEQKTVTVPALDPTPEGATPSPNSPVPVPEPAPRPTVDAPHTTEPSPDAAPERPLDHARGNAQRTAGLVVGGAGVIAMGAGVLLGLSAKSTYDDSSAHCDATGCDRAGLDLRDTAVTKGQVATAIFALGAGAAVGGAVLWFTAPRSRAPLDRTASIALTAQGVAVTGTW